MSWCCIKLVLVGLLGLLCVVHVVSGGTCGQDVKSKALLDQAHLVLQGKILSVTDPDLDTGLYNATILVRNPVLKGKKLLEKGKKGKRITLGSFKKEVDIDKCAGPVKKGKTFIFLLSKQNSESVGGGVTFHMIALPRKRTKKVFKKLKEILCKSKKCGKKVTAPKIKKVVGPRTTINVGKKLTFKCVAKSSPGQKFEWYKDKEQLKPRKGLSIKANKRNSKLVIKKAKLSDQGKYHCVAKNIVGTDVKYAPSFSVRENPKKHRGDPFCDKQTYCLNGGTCLHNTEIDISYCVCPDNWNGQRCELMDPIRIHGHYSRQATLLYERTLIIIGLVIAVLVFIVICIASYFLAKKRREKFEKKKRKKQALRANQPNTEFTKGHTKPFYPVEEKFSVEHNKSYPPISHDTKTFFPGRDNGFDFESAQRQPLLRQHGNDDVDGGPESRRRLVASSMYDNFEESNQNKSANVTGLTTADVIKNSEMIEMAPMGPRDGPLSNSASGEPRHDREKENGPVTQESSLPLFQASPLHTNPDMPSSPTEIHETSMPVTPDLDFEKYKAPPPPILPHSHSSSSPLRHILDPTAEPSPFHSSNSMPTKLVLNGDSTPDHQEQPESSEEHSPLYINHNHGHNTHPYTRPSKWAQPTSSTHSPPSYNTAMGINGVKSDTDTESDVDDDNNIVYPYGGSTKPSNVGEDLHISEEDLGLSAENLLGGSFNSINPPSRQTSLDQEALANDKFKPRRFSIEKQQSEDIINSDPPSKRSWLRHLTPRSYSLDEPPAAKVNGNGPSHLDSTVAENQNAKHDGSIKHHTEDLFDPNDDTTPWDKEQSCNSTYSNLSNDENDRQNRLKDVRPDQPAIPI